MLPVSASRHQARQAKLAIGGMFWLDPTGRSKRVDGGDAIDMPPELFGGPPLTGWARNLSAPSADQHPRRNPRLAAATASPTRPGPQDRQPTERCCISRDHPVLVGHGHRHTLTPHGIEAGEGPEHDHAVVGGQVDVGAGLGDRFAGGPPDGQDGAIQYRAKPDHELLQPQVGHDAHEIQEVDHRRMLGPKRHPPPDSK